MLRSRLFALLLATLTLGALVACSGTTTQQPNGDSPYSAGYDHSGGGGY